MAKRPPGSWGTSSGVATLRTVTAGAPRLASAASIEPCPTSRNVVAPRPASVSIVERQRTGTDTWRASRSRQTVGVGVGDGVVVGDHRGARARRRRGRRPRSARPAVASGISGVWNAPPTLSGGDPAHAELLRAGRAGCERRRGCRRSRPDRARCRWRPSTPSGAAVHASSACSGVAPSSAAILPGWASAAAWVSSARRAANRTPASSGRTPAAMSAVTWPSEWPRERDRRRRRGGLERVPHHERREEHRELRFAGAGERVGRRVGDEVAERLAQRGLGLLDDRPGGVVAPGRGHAGLLGSLSGEDDRDTHVCSCSRSPGSAADVTVSDRDAVPVVTSRLRRGELVPQCRPLPRVTSITRQ